MRTALRRCGLSCATVLVLAMAVGPLPASAQQAGGAFVLDTAALADTTYLPVRDAINAVLPRSAISFYSLKGKPLTAGNMPRTFFEARLAAHFPLYASDRGGTRPESFCLCGVVFTMNADLRMTDTVSMPVRTPSFKPELRLLLQWPGMGPNTFFHLRAYHYSNGEEGPAIDSTGFNYRSGSFSQDVVFGAAWSRGQLNDTNNGFRAYTFLALEAEWFPLSDEVTAVDHGRLKFTGTVSRAVRAPNLPVFPHEGALTLQFAAWPKGAHREGLRMFDSEFTYTVRPFIRSRLGSFGFFVGGYWGRDYYNINYHRGNLSTLRWGIVAVNSDFETGR